MADTPVANLMVSVGANTSGATTALTGLTSMLGKSSLLALGAIAVGAAIAGVGIIAVKMAGDYQAGITSLVTGAGLAENHVGMVSKAYSNGRGHWHLTTELIAGMYASLL